MVPHDTRAGRALDPLTRASVGLQRFADRALGSALSLVFAGVLVLAHHQRVPAWLAALAVPALATALAVAIVRRWHRAAGASAARLELELASLGAVALISAISLCPGGLVGPFGGALHLGFSLVCAFAEPLAAAATWGFVAAILAALPPRAGGGMSSLPLSILLAACGAATWVAVRLHVGETERSWQKRLEREIDKLREAARSYRLIASASRAAPAGAHGTAADPTLDGERLLCSSVDEIHAALRSALTLCRVALASRSVLVLWLDDEGAALHLRAASSQEALREGPFPACEGIYAAALESPSAMQLVGASAARPLPHYAAGPRAVGHVVLLPIIEDARPSGLLVIDRDVARELSPAELEILSETERLVRRTIDNERVVLQLDRAQVEQGKLYRAVERLNEARSEAHVIEAGVSSARDFAAFQFAAVTLLRPGDKHEICAVSGEGARELLGQTFRDPAGLVGMVVANRHPLPYRGQSGASVQILFTKSLRAPTLPSLLVLPLLVHGEVLGTLVLGSREPNVFGGDVRVILQVLAGHIAVSLANARMMKRLEELATTDGLTGLFNKRTLTEIGRQKLRSAERFHKPLSVLVCDLDHFKAVNDTYGHDVGDRVIRGFADVLRRTKRETDAVGRFGGEEFVVVCEQTDTQGAEQLAERIRSELLTTTFVVASGTISVTCSVGVATYPAAGQDWDELFKSTDEALYASKRGGRNLVTVWSPALRPAKTG